MNNSKTYHTDHEYIASTLLKQYAKSPRKAKAYIDGEKQDTTAMMEGRIFHQMMDEDHSFKVFDANDRPEPDKTFASKANKEWKASVYDTDRDVIDMENYVRLDAMVQSVMNSKFYQTLQGVRLESQEEGYYSEVAGCKIKCKPDALYEGANGSIVCIDWKTTSESLTSDPWVYQRICRKFGYDLSAVHYSEVLRNHFMKEVHYFLVFVENKEPYEVMPVYISRQGEMYQQTFDRWIEAVQGLTKCLQTGKWPGIESQVTNYIEL